MKIERLPNEIRLYWNDKNNYSYRWTNINGAAHTQGGIKISNVNATKMVIDNLYISTSEAPTEPITVSASGARKLDGSGVDITAYIYNKTSAEIENAGTVIAAAYNGECLVKAGMTPIGTLPANLMDGTATSTPVPVALTLDNPENCSYKLYVWNMGTLTPIYGVVDIPSI